MAKLRKFSAYQKLERPYTRVSKFSNLNYVRGGYPNIKISKFDMGNTKATFDTTLKLNVLREMNIRHNALEAARMTSNRLLEKTINNAYHLKVKPYPFHVLRENPLASGAGADRMSTGMKLAYGKTIGAAARMKLGQTVIELKLNKENVKLGREALARAARKLPCSCKIVVG
ncbi:50S ribosomal protein L16 [Candidatus Woesearchaeota archaeon]|nr:50S ribosomal protein L16 [Candidatus Woesearchaeota archaeon]